jgi:hypothetical protein
MKSIISKLLPKNISTPLGRWKIEDCNAKMNYKVDLSNEDHCGPCGQYALEKIELKNVVTDKNIDFDNQKK